MFSCTYGSPVSHKRSWDRAIREAVRSYDWWAVFYDRAIREAVRSYVGGPCSMFHGPRRSRVHTGLPCPTKGRGIAPSGKPCDRTIGGPCSTIVLYGKPCDRTLVGHILRSCHTGERRTVWPMGFRADVESTRSHDCRPTFRANVVRWSSTLHTAWSRTPCGPAPFEPHARNIATSLVNPT
jgi:hypothetical protein